MIRISSGQLYSLAELKVFLREFLRRYTADAEVDFQQLLYVQDQVKKQMSMEELQSGVSGGDKLSAADQTSTQELPKSTVPMPAELQQLSEGVEDTSAPLEALDATALDSAKAKMRHLLLLLHRAVLYVVTVSREQRKGRLTLLKEMVSRLEQAGALPS